MTAVRHLRPVRGGDPIPEWEHPPPDSPDPSVPRTHPAWRPPAWWGLLEEHRWQLEDAERRIPWERHPARAVYRLEFRAP